MIAQSFRDLAGVVFHAFAHRCCLRGAGFTARAVGRICKRSCRRTLFGHADHRLLDDVDIFLLQRYAIAFFWHGQLPGLGGAVLDHFDQVRLHHHTVVAQVGYRVRELYWRKRVVALTDTHRDSFAGIPFLQFRPLVILALPLLRRQHATSLVFQINAGQLSKTERFHEIMNGINAQIIGKHVIVGVTRLHNRFVHIDTAVTAFLVITEAIVTEHEVTRIEDAELRCALAQFQCRQCHVGLEGGAGRIAANQCAIEQRFVERCIKFFPAFRVDAFNEKIRIVGGHGYVSKNIARFRLNGY